MRTLEELNAQLGRLHDAVLLRIDMEWAEGTVTLDVRTANGLKQLIVGGVTRLLCPREYPWGRSVCINEVRFGSPPPNGALLLEIEMQSGDVLTVCGSEIVAGGDGT
jgi:hypothetical protein